MDLLRKIGSGILFVLAIVSFIAALLLLPGIWWARSWLDMTAGNAATLLSSYVSLAAQTISEVDERLAGAEQRIANVTGRIEQATAGGPDSPAAQGLRQTVNEEIAPRLEALANTVPALLEALESYNETAARVNRTPFVTLPTIDVDVEALSARAAAAADQARQLREAAVSLDGSRLRAAVTTANTAISDARASIARVQAGVAQLQVGLANLRATIATWLTIAAWVLSPLLLLFAAGQASLAAHAWGWMRAKRVEAAPTRRPA